MRRIPATMRRGFYAVTGASIGVYCSSQPVAAAEAPKKKVVVTGASGMIAQLALPALRERYDVVALDIREAPGVAQCDLLGPRDDIRHFFQGAHAVFHSAFVPPPKDVSIATSSFLASNIKGGSAQEKEATVLKAADRLFEAENLNVRMAFNVYQTAVEEGVKRVVMSSSNHANDFFEPLILEGGMSPAELDSWLALDHGGDPTQSGGARRA